MAFLPKMAFWPRCKGKKPHVEGYVSCGVCQCVEHYGQIGSFSAHLLFFSFFLSDPWRTPIFPPFFFYIEIWAQKKNALEQNLTCLFMGDVLAPLILAENTTTSTNALAATWIKITRCYTTLPLCPCGHLALFMPFSAYSFAAYGHSVSDIHLNTVQPSGGLATQVFALLGLILSPSLGSV